MRAATARWTAGSRARSAPSLTARRAASDAKASAGIVSTAAGARISRPPSTSTSPGFNPISSHEPASGTSSDSVGRSRRASVRSPAARPARAAAPAGARRRAAWPAGADMVHSAQHWQPFDASWADFDSQTSAPPVFVACVRRVLLSVVPVSRPLSRAYGV